MTYDNDITAILGKLYHPVKALLIYNNPQENNSYVEAYDMDTDGRPINAHRLSIRESIALAKALDTSEELKQKFLKPVGLLPENVLYINPDRNGYAIWYTPAQEVTLFFMEDLGIPDGKAFVPPMVWRANRGGLWVYALTDDTALSADTPLYHAPFFNIGQDGKVCMGTVNIDLAPNAGLEEFIGQWQAYFFNSYFSHLIGGNAVKGNIVQLWQKLIGSSEPFPADRLIEHKFSLKRLIQ
jgi:PRTRC genetic system protein B